MPFNPVRRNRNIGTPKQGHGQNNRMIVPRPWISAGWCAAQLNPGQMLRRTVNGRDVTLIVEKTSGGCVHACSVEDVIFLLSHVPLADWAGLETFVLRQPTRKARVLRPAWGRMFYYADLGFRGSSIEKVVRPYFWKPVTLATPSNGPHRWTLRMRQSWTDFVWMVTKSAGLGRSISFPPHSIPCEPRSSIARFCMRSVTGLIGLEKWKRRSPKVRTTQHFMTAILPGPKVK